VGEDFTEIRQPLQWVLNYSRRLCIETGAGWKKPAHLAQ